MAFTTESLTNSYALGKDGALTVGGETLGGVKSVSINCEAEEVDISARGDGGFTKALPGTRSVTIEVTFNKNETDAGQVGLRTLWLGSDYSSKGVEITAKSGSSGTGVTGTFVLTSLSEEQPLDGVTECAASFKNFGAVTAATSSSSGGGGVG